MHGLPSINVANENAARFAEAKRILREKAEEDAKNTTFEKVIEEHNQTKENKDVA